MRIPTIIKCDWKALAFEIRRYLKQNFEEPYEVTVGIAEVDPVWKNTERATISVTNGDKHKIYCAYFTNGEFTVVYSKNNKQREYHIEQIWELCDILVNNLE